ncbi:MAG: lipocalin-like domain-containing protein [Candidatus Promineifilaceae bacterium]
MRRYLIGLLLLLVVLLTFWFVRSPSAAPPANAALESLLVENDQTSAAFARATTPDAIHFPQDLGPHEDYQTEWWYYTGNLETDNGREFGYQFTIFRRALTPPSETPAVDNASDWRSNQVYLAHFTVSDIEGNEFFATERFSRGAAGLAGAQAEPYRVWLEDWSVAEVMPGVVRIQARTGEVKLDITLTETMPRILHGDGGLSQKGAEPGNASYYYSIVQQATDGRLRIGDQTFEVTGRSWNDHEYSTSALSPGSVGWDWFSLQFDDGRALMLFQIRREDGTIEPYSSGSFIEADGSVRSLPQTSWRVEVLDNWTSPSSGAEYPSRWRLTIPEMALELEGRALMPDQELAVSTTYWEGAVAFEGSMAGQPLEARGYIELTGYAAAPVPE